MWQEWLLSPFYRWESWRSQKSQRPDQGQAAHKWCSGYWHFSFKNRVYDCQIYVITHTEINKILIKGLWRWKRFKTTISVVVVVFQKPMNEICSCNDIKTSPGNLVSLISVLVTLLLTQAELGHRVAVGIIRLGDGGCWTREVLLYFVSYILQASEQSYQPNSSTWAVGKLGKLSEVKVKEFPVFGQSDSQILKARAIWRFFFFFFLTLYQLWSNLVFISYLHSLKLSWLLVITPSPSSKALPKQNAKWQHLVFLGDSIWQSLQPASPAPGLRWQSHVEHCCVLNGNNRMGSEIQLGHFFLEKLTTCRPWLTR